MYYHTSLRLCAPSGSSSNIKRQQRARPDVVYLKASLPSKISKKYLAQHISQRQEGQHHRIGLHGCMETCEVGHTFACRSLHQTCYDRTSFYHADTSDCIVSYLSFPYTEALVRYDLAALTCTIRSC